MESSCANCGSEVQVTHKEPCAACGATARHFEQTINVQASSRVSIKGEATGRKLTGGKRRIAEFFDGWDLRKSVGDWVRKTRMINRPANRYFERVEDEAGNVIRHCDEPLSDHHNRGSAKPKS